MNKVHNGIHNSPQVIRDIGKMVTCPTQTQKAQPGIKKVSKLEILISIQSTENTTKFLIVIRFQVTMAYFFY